ncbi:MAG: FeoA family protein [Eubacteriales bacterium]
MTLAEGSPGNQYKVLSLDTQDPELESFLLTLGCYSGETISLVSEVSSSYVVAIRDGRYNIDKNLASAIVVESVS